VVKEMGKFVYLGSETNSGGKIGGEINRTVQNSSEFYRIIKGMLWNRGPKIMQKNSLESIF
jgi:hypothetical protein